MASDEVKTCFNTCHLSLFDGDSFHDYRRDRFIVAIRFS